MKEKSFLEQIEYKEVSPMGQTLINNQTPLVGVSEVQEILGISRSKAYQIIKELNMELKRDGFITINGRVSRKYFKERIGL